LFLLEGTCAEAVGSKRLTTIAASSPHPFSKVFEGQGNFFQKVSLQVQDRVLQKTLHAGAGQSPAKTLHAGAGQRPANIPKGARQHPC